MVFDKGKGKLFFDVVVKSDEVGSLIGGGVGGEKNKSEELGFDFEDFEINVDEGISVEEVRIDLVGY